MFVGKVSKSLLYENVVKKLVEMIDHGIVGPGGQFPSERELVESMQVSRNVLREAFHILEEKGVIFSIQGKGRFLREIPDGLVGHPTAFELQKYTLLELYQVRVVLELGTMDILADELDESDIADLEMVYQRLAEHFTMNGSTKGEFEMHLAYATKSHNEYLKSLLQNTTKRVLGMMQGEFSDLVVQYDVEWFVQDHREIIDALRNRDRNAARAAMQKHLDRTSYNIKIFPTRAAKNHF